jgi:hypothetical protein
VIDGDEGDSESSPSGRHNVDEWRSVPRIGALKKKHGIHGRLVRIERFTIVATTAR